MTPTHSQEAPANTTRALRGTVVGFAAVLLLVACCGYFDPFLASATAFAGLGIVSAVSLSSARRIELWERLDEVHRDTDEVEKQRLVEERDELEQEVSDLRETARELELARQEADTASLAKGAFLAHTSHEIRTPLNGILGMGRLMAETELTREQRDFNGTILESAEALLVLLNDILDLSKIEAGKLELDECEFDLHDNLEKATQLLVPKAAEKGLELICSLEKSVPRHVRGDASRLRQIIVNLLGNAIKFTESGEVELAVVVDGGVSDEFTLKVSVRDTGPGISSDRVGRIFEPFTQAGTSLVRRLGGAGLGLTIGRQLAETMGGDMGVESKEGRGSVFWFTACLAPVPAATEDPGAWNALRGLRALLIDDNDTVRRLVRGYLEAWDVECVDVATRQQALAAITRKSAPGRGFDVALIDSDLDGCDGIELAQTILQDQSIEPPQLVLLKDFRCQYKANRLTRIGFDAWISKPIWPDVMREALLHLRDVAEQVEVRDALRRSPTPTPATVPVDEALFDLDVLLAEDNLVNQKVATLLLQKLGCSVDVASNGKKAVDAARAKRYDLIFMDCQMPVMNGYDATRAIRSSDLQGLLPIVAMTAGALAEDRKRSLEAGMDDHLSKPVNLDQLRSVLDRWTKVDPPAPSGNQVNPMTDDHMTLDLAVVASLRELSDDESDLFAELVDLFFEDTPPRLEALQSALDAGDAKALEAAAHGLKSSCANIGALAMSEMCRQIEALGREREPGAATELVEQSSHEYERVRVALEAELG